ARSGKWPCRWSSTNTRTASSRPSSSARSTEAIRAGRGFKGQGRRVPACLTGPPSMEQVVANGLYLGAQYALIALGLTLIFALMNVLNFAHGQMYVLGGFMTYLVYGRLGLPFFVAVLASGATLALVGALVEKFLFRPVIRRSLREESTMLLAAAIAF